MVSRVFSCTFTGLDCQIIEVQADICSGMPSFSIVGLGDTAIQESRERVRSAIKNSEYEFPANRKTINLAPAHIRKQGALFDLPIAISILLASQKEQTKFFDNSVIVGEMSLTGKVKKIKGALLITQHAKEKGFERIFLPQENIQEATLIKGIEVYPIGHLKELISFSLGQATIAPHPHTPPEITKIEDVSAFENIVGLTQAKRALTIAAAGGHNALLFGSPGCGKTVISRAFKAILSPMSYEEVMESTKIFSISGLLMNDTTLITKRPFREVHHTATQVSIIGGGVPAKPGEISLAHNGILFLDEIAEFPRKVLETLRQPIEDKYININRQNKSHIFPSNFTLLATMNPCPCGFMNDKKTLCSCTQSQINNYRRKLSGPLIDRIDLFIHVKKSPMGKLFKENKSTPTPYSKIIGDAINIQRERFKKHPSINKNSDMTFKSIKEFCTLEEQEQQLMEKASNTLNLSNRGYLRTLKIARTIADLEGSEKILTPHIAEAISYRNTQ